MTAPLAAVILAGGQGRRLGGQDKPALLVGGRTLLDRALAAVPGGPIVVVGPPRSLPEGVRIVSEDPPGGGPAAGVAAGFVALPELPVGAVVAVLAADLPGIDAPTVSRLCDALSADSAQGADGAVLLDPDGRRQYLIGVWRHGALQAAIGRRPGWHGRPLRELLEPIAVIEIPGSDREAADIDTPSDLRRWQV